MQLGGRYTWRPPWGSFARKCHGKSVQKGFRSRDTTARDTIAASFKFNDVMNELHAKLDSGEELLLLVKLVKDVERRRMLARRRIGDSAGNLF